MPGFLVEEGGMEKLVIVAISLILLTESLDRKQVTVLFINDVDIFIIVRVEEFSLVISLENALYLKNGLCQSFPHLVLCLRLLGPLVSFPVLSYRARQLYKNISMLFLFPVDYGKLSTGVNAQRFLSCYG